MNITNFASVTLAVCCALSFVACANEAGSPSTATLPYHYMIQNDNIRASDDISDFFDVQIIRIDESVNSRLGNYIDEVLFLREQLIVVSRRTGYIISVDAEGNLLWELRAGSSPINMFQQIDLFDYHEKAERLEIYDDLKSRFLYFDLNGQFIDSRTFRIVAKDYINLNDSCLLYAISEYPNNLSFDLPMDPSLISVCGESLVTAWRFEDTSPLQPIPFLDYNEFNEFGGRIYYQRSFSDSFFLVKQNELELAYLVNFSRNDKSQSVADDPQIESEFMHLFENEIPYTWQTIISDGGEFYGIYNQSRKNFFTIIDRTGRTLVNSAYLRSNDLVFTNFDEYWRGYFFDVMYDYEFDFYQEALPANGYAMDDRLKEDLEQLTDENGDRAGRVFVVGRMKSI